MGRDTKEKRRSETIKVRAARFLCRKGRRLCAAALCVTLILSNVGIITGATGDIEKDPAEFTIDRDELRDELIRAVGEELEVTKPLEFAGNEAERYEELFDIDEDADSSLYELKPEMEKTGKDLQLKIYAKVEKDRDLDGEEGYLITGSEELIFLLKNSSSKAKRAVIHVGDMSSPVITVAAKDSIAVPQEATPSNETLYGDENVGGGTLINAKNAAGSGNSFGGGSTSGSGSSVEEGSISGGGDSAGDGSSIFEDTDIQETHADITGEEKEPEVIESEESTETVEQPPADEPETEDESQAAAPDSTEESDLTGAPAEAGDKNIQEPEENLTENNDTAENSTAVDENSDESGEETDNETTDIGADDTESSSIEADEASNTQSDTETENDTVADTGSEEGEDVEVNDSTTEDSQGEAVVCISEHRVSRVATTWKASPSDAEADDMIEEGAEEATSSDATSSDATPSDLYFEMEGELYNAVRLGDTGAVAFVTTAEKLGLDDIIYKAELENVTVRVAAKGETFSEPVTLKAEELLPEGDTAEKYIEAETALMESDTDYSGMIALDLRFEDEAGNEIEPELPVKVSIRMNQKALPTDVFPETISVQHLEEDKETGTIAEVKTVADVTDATTGTVVADGEDAVAAYFEVESFSTFTLTWNSWGSNDSLSIDCIDIYGNQIAEDAGSNPISGEESVNDIAPKLRGYTFLKACLDSVEGTEIHQLRKRYNGTWQYGIKSRWGGTSWSNIGDKKVLFVYSPAKDQSGIIFKYEPVNDETYNINKEGKNYIKFAVVLVDENGNQIEEYKEANLNDKFKDDHPVPDTIEISGNTVEITQEFFNRYIKIPGYTCEVDKEGQYCYFFWGAGYTGNKNDVQSFTNMGRRSDQYPTGDNFDNYISYTSSDLGKHEEWNGYPESIAYQSTGTLQVVFRRVTLSDPNKTMYVSMGVEDPNPYSSEHPTHWLVDANVTENVDYRWNTSKGCYEFHPVNKVDQSGYTENDLKNNWKAAPEGTGWKLAGWSLECDETGNGTEDSLIPADYFETWVNTDVILYAHWVKNDAPDKPMIKVQKVFKGLTKNQITGLTDFKITVGDYELVLNEGTLIKEDVANNEYIYEWILDNVDAGTYKVEEFGEKISDYVVTTLGVGESVSTSAAKLSINTTGSINDGKQTEYKLPEGTSLIVAKLKESSKEGCFVWTSERLSASGRAAVIEWINKQSGSGQSGGSAENIKFYSGDRIEDDDGLSFNGTTIRYDKTTHTLHLGDKSNWQKIWYGNYQYDEARGAELVITNTYEWSIVPPTGLSTDKTPYLLMVIFALCMMAAVFFFKRRARRS